MSYLLDINVFSELVRARPDRKVLQWIEDVNDDALFPGVLSLGEIRKAVERLTNAARREKLRLWLEHDLRAWFGPRILPIEPDVADRWGRLLADAGRPVTSIDSLLAATDLHHELRIFSRNVKDFDYAGVEAIDPWRSRA